MSETWLERQKRTAMEASGREQERQKPYTYDRQMELKRQEDMRQYVEERRVQPSLREKMREQIRHIKLG